MSQPDFTKCCNYTRCNNNIHVVVTETRNGMCMDCIVTIGRYEIVTQMEDCPVCLENKHSVMLVLNHRKVCMDCWYEIISVGFSKEEDEADRDSDSDSDSEKEKKNDKENDKENEENDKCNAFIDVDLDYVVV